MEERQDLISRQAAIDAIMGQPPEPHYPSWYAEQIKALPSAQPEQRSFSCCQENDLISRRAAIDKLDPIFESLAIDKIKALPTAQPEQRWIPVSERLPEDEYVLISKIPTNISGSKWSVAIAIRTADPRSRKIQWRDSGFGVIQDDKVLAWMPLPQPYKAESEDKE
jgi:hypothetical protein